MRGELREAYGTDAKERWPCQRQYLSCEDAAAGTVTASVRAGDRQRRDGTGGNAASTPLLTGAKKIARPARRRDLRLAGLGAIVPVFVPAASPTHAKVPVNWVRGSNRRRVPPSPPITVEAAVEA
jgi:hypothetical protein